jgi:hypothetical protein
MAIPVECRVILEDIVENIAECSVSADAVSAKAIFDVQSEHSVNSISELVASHYSLVSCHAIVRGHRRHVWNLAYG